MLLTESPLVSIIIPAYNSAPYLKGCLDSLISQTFKNFEAIIIDDGSTDETSTIAKSYSESDSRFVYNRQKNKGVSSARNAGIKIAKGEFLYFLDSDDKITPDMLYEVTTIAKKTHSSMIHFNATTQRLDEKTRSNITENNYIRNITEKTLHAFDDMICTKQYKCPVWLYLIRNDFIKSNQLTFIEGIIHEDEVFTLKACLICDNSTFINKAFVIRQLRHGSIMNTSYSLKNINGYLQGFLHLANWINNYAITSKKRRDFANKQIAMLYSNALRGSIRIDQLKWFRGEIFIHYSTVLKYNSFRMAIAPFFTKKVAKLLSN